MNRGNSGGGKLREWRDHGHIPARSIADLVPCSLRTLYRWERGQTVPSVPHAVRLQNITRGAVRVETWQRREDKR